MATVPITFPMGGGPMQYTNRCAKVKLGSMVTFTGSFASHPLAPAGGDPGTQIPSQNADPPGGSVSFTVSTKGTFGYHCGFHPSDMFGAIQVVP